ncbi:MAG: hypothetical protein RJQ09_09810 [Cyclobacteriaceae bacterium]
MKLGTIITLLLLSYLTLIGQNSNSKDYYYEIPEAPDEYTETNVIARLVDGLGFRFYWASEGLTDKDLMFKSVEGARTARETLHHIYGLSLTLVDAVTGDPNYGPEEESGEWVYSELRLKTLANIQRASELMKSAKPGDMDNYKITFVRGENTSEFQFWNMINGPIADAIYHTGQVVTLRRASGNPINPNISVLNGKVRDN